MHRLTRVSLVLFVLAAPMFAAESPLLGTIKVNPKSLRGDGSAIKTDAARPNRIGAQEVANRLRDAVLRSAAASSQPRILKTKETPSNAIASRADVTISWRSNGTPLQIRGEQALQASRSHAISASAIDTAREFLRDNRGVLKLMDPDRELVVTDRSVDNLGRTQIRFDQVHEGLTVWPSEVIVHLDARGNVDLLDGAYVPTPRRMRTLPLLSSQHAITKARGTECAGAATSVPELVILARDERRPRLAWKLTVHESLTKRWLTVVDAMNGAVLERFNTIETAKTTGSGRDLRGQTRSLNLWQEGSSFYMLDASKSMFDPSSGAPSPQTTRGGIFVADATNLPPTSEPEELPSSLAVARSGSANSWPVADTVSAAYLISQTYDYFLQNHGREGIDGRKGTIMGIVRLGRNFPNAFWNGEQQLMVFGDADTYAGTLDVIAHEMTHGVTSNSSRLVYQGQSGALNEAMSDIFGEMAEFRTYGSNDWIIGTHMRSPIRSMSDPKRFGDPARMSEFLVTKQDNGGVHSNSGIINRAFYLLAQGMPGAIGRGDAEKIFYRALTRHLTKNSQFIDARLAAITSAQELFGANSNQAAKTGEAFDLVEIFAAGSGTPQTPDVPVVQGPDSTLFLYKDTTKNAWFLARRETPPDPAQGALLSRFDVSVSRPAVTADGTMAAFVDSINDICLIETRGGSEEVCAGLPQEGIEVASVGMSPDGSRYGVVLRDNDGDPIDRIIVVDLEGDPIEIDLSTPLYDSDFNLSSVDYADAMTFTHDGRFIVYDALTEVFADGSPWAAWAIYAYDLEEGVFHALIPPIEGLDIGFPSLGHTSDDLLTFEAYDPATGEAAVAVADLYEGEISIIGEQEGVAASPSFTGDDRAVIYARSASNGTGAQLVRQNLAADHLTPTGNVSGWIGQGAFGVMYRRGTYAGPTTQPGAIAFTSTSYGASEGAVATIAVVRSGGNKGAVSVSYTTANGTASGGSDFQSTSGTLTWADGEEGVKSFQVRALTDTANEGVETATLRLTTTGGGSTLGNPSTATLSIANVAGQSQPAGGKRRSTRH